MLTDLFDLVQEAKKLPDTLKGAMAEAAEAAGLRSYPKIHAVVRPAGAGWELVAVSLDPALLPEAGPGEFRLSGRLDR